MSESSNQDRFYSKHTLVGNWQEERLAHRHSNSVLPTSAKREKHDYSTTHGSSFVTPRREVNEIKVKKAQDSDGSPIGDGCRFNMNHSTTHNRDFGNRVKTTIRDIKFKNGEANAPPAGGACSTSGTTELTATPGTGMIGERLKNGDDPKNNTASQRSWMASAPELAPSFAVDGGCVGDCSFMSLSIGERGEEESKIDNSRKSTMGLTTVPNQFQRVKKVQIFQDY